MNPRRLLAAVLLVALAALLATLHSTAFASTNFTVEAIEITQAQQIEPRGEIQGVTDCGSEFDPVEPLIARRRTGSRVLVTRSDGPIPVVQGYLTVTRGGKTVWQGHADDILVVSHVDVCDIVRHDETQTLNLEVPYDLLTTGIYTFSVLVYADNNPSQGKTMDEEVFFVHRRAPRVLGVSIDYQYPVPAVNVGTPEPSRLEEGVAEAMVWAAWPLREQSGVGRYVRHPDDFPVDYEVNAIPLPNGEVEWRGHCDLSNEIADLRMRTSPRADFAYGFMRGSTAGNASAWTCGGGGAVGHTDLARYQKSFAHEFGHEIGSTSANPMRHPGDIPGFGSGIGDVGWDVFNAIAQGRPRPDNLNPIMGGRHVTNGSWSHVHMYQVFTMNSMFTLAPRGPEYEIPPIPSPSPSQ